MKNVKKLKIGDFIDQVRGVTYSSDDVIEKSREGYLPVLRANGIYDGELNFEDLVYVPMKKISDIQLIKKGDIIMAASSGSKQVVGKTAFVFEDWEGGFGAFCKVIRTKPSLNPLYLSFYFRSKIYRGIISNIVTGANINNIRNDDLNNLEIPLPDLKTQQEIAQVLEQADKARQQRKAANVLTDQFLQSSFLALFGDPVKNEKGWEVKKIGEVIQSIRYGTGSPPEYSDTGIPFIRATNIKNGRIEKPGMVFVSDDEATKIEKCRVKKGDWLIVRSGANTGDAAVVTEEYENSLAGYDLIVELKFESAIFYNQLINSDYGVKILEPLTRRAGQPHLNSDQIKNLEFYFPPLPLQQQFAGIVAQAEQLRQKQRESERELENLFQGLLQRYFE